MFSSIQSYNSISRSSFPASVLEDNGDLKI